MRQAVNDGTRNFCRPRSRWPRRWRPGNVHCGGAIRDTARVEQPQSHPLALKVVSITPTATGSAWASGRTVSGLQRRFRRCARVRAAAAPHTPCNFFRKNPARFTPPGYHGAVCVFGGVAPRGAANGSGATAFPALGRLSSTRPGPRRVSSSNWRPERLRSPRSGPAETPGGRSLIRLSFDMEGNGRP